MLDGCTLYIIAYEMVYLNGNKIRHFRVMEITVAPMGSLVIFGPLKSFIQILFGDKILTLISLIPLLNNARK